MQRFYVGCTRFNEKTKRENEEYRKKKNIVGCIYGCPIKIREDIPRKNKIIVIEMNNEKNIIIAFGFIYNIIRFDKRFCIYDNQHFNRYVYLGQYRITREEIFEKEDENMKQFIEKLEKLLFKGKTHSKRGSGITILPPRITMLNPEIKPKLEKLFKTFRQFEF